MRPSGPSRRLSHSLPRACACVRTWLFRWARPVWPSGERIIRPSPLNMELYLLALFEEPLQKYSPWYYSQLYLECGMIGQAFYHIARL